jgi:hypothetical protein
MIKLFRGTCLLCLVAVASLQTACEPASPASNDSSPPKAEILFQQPDNQYVPSTTANLGSEQLNITFKASDPGGIKSIKLTFFNTLASKCAFPGGGIQTSTFPISLPGPFEVNPPLDAQGKAPTFFGWNVSIQRPTCKELAAGGQIGIPVGHVIKAVCTAKNYSTDAQSNTGTATADITITY